MIRGLIRNNENKKKTKNQYIFDIFNLPNHFPPNQKFKNHLNQVLSKNNFDLMESSYQKYNY